MSGPQPVSRPAGRVPYDAVFATVYAGLRINLCLLAACLPVILAFAFAGSPLAAWPFFVGLSALCGPAASAAFGTFEALTDDPQRVVRVFWAAYRAGFARSLATAAAAAFAVIVLGVDLRLAVGTPFGAVTPLLVVLIALVVLLTPTVLVAGRRPTWRLLGAAAYLAVRTWYLGLADLAVLGVLLAAVVAKPAVGLLVLPAPALYVVWANARHTLSPLTADPGSRAGTALHRHGKTGKGSADEIDRSDRWTQSPGPHVQAPDGRRPRDGGAAGHRAAPRPRGDHLDQPVQGGELGRPA